MATYLDLCKQRILYACTSGLYPGIQAVYNHVLIPFFESSVAITEPKQQKSITVSLYLSLSTGLRAEIDMTTARSHFTNTKTNTLSQAHFGAHSDTYSWF